MTVYEMIQELAQYDSDVEVGINVVSDGYRTTVGVEKDVKGGEETDVNVEFNEDIQEFSIEEYTMLTGRRSIRILVEVE